MKRIALSFVFCLLLVSSSAWASTDFVDWGQLGPPFTVLTTPQTFTSSGTTTGIVGLNDFGNFERRDQGNGWNGNFNPGDHLIWNQGEQGPDPGITMIFDQATFGGGAQIEADQFGIFTATLSVYDLGLNLMTTVTMTGDSESTGDGSAIFIGFQSNSADVGALKFDVVSSTGQDALAIGGLTVYTSGMTGTPEPNSLLLLGSGLVGVIGYGRRRLGL